MKTFRYPLGHVDMVTMTVSELREKLNEFPQDMPVLAEWEGTWNSFEPECFAAKRSDHWHQDDNCEVLVINVEAL